MTFRPKISQTAPETHRGAVFLSLVLLGLLAACAPPSYWAMRSGRDVPLRQDALADALVARAKALGLAHSQGWLKLVHYRKDAYGGPYRSEADGTGFFLAPLGKFDPEAELEATVRAVLAPARGSDAPSLDAHAACAFPARVLWLMKALALDPRLLGVTHCPGFDAFLAEMRPSGVTLIFTSYYLNNPASAFGHTFLRVHKHEPLAVGKKRELLDYGIDFSANVTTNNPISYTIAGLAGMFEGTFKRVPYYYKVREYNDVESRDLWEYELDFTPSELLLLTAHVWEVGRTHFDYFYLGENCSYAILALVAAAKPELDLLSHVPSPVVPAATVQALFTQPGLVRAVHYRPSLRTQFEARVRDLSAKERDLVDALLADAELPLPPDLPSSRAVQVFDAAADLVDIRFAKELLTEREDTPGARLKQRLLERRAQLRVPSPRLEVDARADKAPERGHRPGRVGLSVGRDAGDNLFVGTDFRLALHDLADPTDGFPEGSSIEFLPVRLRFGEVDGRFRVRVDQADLARVTSLSPLTRFDRHISFQVAAGLRGVDDRICRDCIAGHFLIGSGLTTGLFDDAVMLFGLLDAQLFVGPPFRSGSKVPLRAGAGPSGGLRVRLHPDLVFVARGNWYYLPYQEPRSLWQSDAVLRFQFMRNFALSAEGRVTAQGVEGQGFLLAYF